MRLTARGFKPGPVFDSFAGIYDIKTGAQIILLFGILNKVAGVYGLISAFTGGSVAQLSFYVYSAVTIAVLVWGSRGVAEESSSKTLKLAHLYALDHIIQTIYTLKFARHYWYENPHDGERIINSQAQRDLIDLAISRGEVSRDRPEDIAEIAYGLWQREKGFAAFVLFLAWCVKIYFILVLYSYTAHLRSKTYHSLPLSSSNPEPSIHSTTDEWASTAPREPTHPDYQGSLHDGMTMEDALQVERNGNAGGKGKKSRTTVDIGAGTQEEEFRWDSDEENEGGKK